MAESSIDNTSPGITRAVVALRSELILFLLVSICVGFVYLSIAPSNLTNANFGSDAGDFLAAVLTRGIPHPTGYPTYIIFGIFLQYLPLNTAVFRGVLESLIPAAIAAGLLTAWILHVIEFGSTLRLVAAVLAGFAWGVAPLLFSQAVIVEVHGLQSLFVVVVLWWITLNFQGSTRSSKRWILALSFLTGLGLGNHVTLALLAPIALIAFILNIYRYKDWKLAIGQLLLILAGLLVYVYLPVRAHAYPPINWGNPQTWAGFLWEVTGNPYRALVFEIQKSTLVERLHSVASLLMDQFGAIGLVAGVVGLVQYSFKNKWYRWILLWIFIAYFAFSIGYNTQDSIGYLIPAIMVYAIWIGLSVPFLAGLRYKSIPYGLLLTSLLVVSVAWRVPATRLRLDPRDQDQPARYAEQLLGEAPTGAIVYTTTDQDTFPLWYYHYGLGKRPDLRVVVPALTQFVWYQETLMHTYPDLKYPQLYQQDTPDSNWGAQIQALNPERPVCHTSLSAESETGVAFRCKSP